MLGWVGKLYWLTKKRWKHGNGWSYCPAASWAFCGTSIGCINPNDCVLVTYIHGEKPSPTKKYPNKPMQQNMIHPRKINSWNLNMMLWKMIFLFQGARIYSQVPAVNLPGCIHPEGMQLDDGLWQFSKLFPELQWRLDTPSDGSSDVWQVAETSENWCIISYIAELYISNLHVPCPIYFTRLWDRERDMHLCLYVCVKYHLHIGMLLCTLKMTQNKKWFSFLRCVMLHRQSQFVETQRIHSLTILFKPLPPKQQL